MSGVLRVGVVGLGTVGAATVKLLCDQAPLLSLRCNKKIEVTAVSARDRSKNRGILMNGITWYDDPMVIANNEQVDVVVELVGGSDGLAKDLVELAITNGKHVVTANKALITEDRLALLNTILRSGVDD